MREGKNQEASQKILNLLEYSASFNYRVAKVTQDADLLMSQLIEAFKNKDIDDMSQKAEDLYNNLQRMEKDVSILYTVRRMLHLGITEDLPAAEKVLKLQVDALRGEFFNLNE